MIGFPWVLLRWYALEVGRTGVLVRWYGLGWKGHGLSGIQTKPKVRQALPDDKKGLLLPLLDGS